MILGSTMQQPGGPRVSPPHHKRSPRPDSPGGYFTLSDSDGASNPGTESSEENGPSPRSTTPMYKIFKNSQLRSRSEPPPSNFIPPRPSPPKESLNQVENDEVGPPRPPPPLSYTSTLPPPVPKKMNKMRSQSVKNRLVNPPPPPPPLAHFGPRPKPLQRVQPLQIQSPSMINILQGNSHRKQNSTSSNSSDDNSIEMKRSEPVSFVKTFQKAASTSTYNGGNSDLRPRPVLKKKAETAGYMRPTKTAVLKQNDHVKNARKSSSSCGSSSSSSETENDKKQKKAVRKSPSSSSESDNATPKKSRSSGKNGKKSSKNTAENPGGKFKKLKNTVNELKRSASEKVVVIKNSAAVSSADSKECGKNDVKTEAKPSENETALFKNPIQSLIKFYEDSQVDKRKVGGNKELVVLEDKDEAADNDTKRISVTSSKSTNTSHLSQISQLSAEKIQSWLNNPMVSLEQDWSVTEVNILDQYVTDMISMTEVIPKVPKVPVIPTLVTTPRDEIIKRNVVIDIKCEDDIIVPNVSSTIPKRAAKSNNCDINSNRIIEVKKVSEKSSKSPKIKRKSITVIEDKIPSEEEISHGVFTEVSCAGNVTQKKIDLVKSHFENAPIPSPRVKKKARKEQMLLEHKEKGREALSLAMKQLKSEPTAETLAAIENNNENDGLQCLDDLCTQSRYVEEDIKKHQQNNAAAATKSHQALCVSKDDQVGVGQSYRLNP